MRQLTQEIIQISCGILSVSVPTVSSFLTACKRTDRPAAPCRRSSAVRCNPPKFLQQNSPL
ncbi:hypothetical protein CLOHYLEM_06570 [[Clostridium] hylemonae DSM 15053]|uniref:Uncharacterized protein n=1 Tax=[Clostridium] hylemonae DSM 15053 TaxID=553973 RepID=C0C3A9_9FIRM|nr:hypothetical protein CLOHYLEM_06570 [[Clostridium] hylemonae DSM 15053]